MEVRGSDKSAVLENSWDKVTGTKTILAKLIITSIEGYMKHYSLLMKHLTGKCPADHVGIKDVDKCLLMNTKFPHDRVA